jgi:hypothetical protein
MDTRHRLPTVARFNLALSIFQSLCESQARENLPLPLPEFLDRCPIQILQSMQMVMGVGVELVTWGVLFASLLAEKATTSAAPMPTVIHIVADGKKVRLR